MIMAVRRLLLSIIGPNMWRCLSDDSIRLCVRGQLL